MGLKNQLRRVYGLRKKKYLLEEGNFHHSCRRDRLLEIIGGCKDGKVIGSYINIPQKQIIPPFIQNCIYAFPEFSLSDRKMTFIRHRPESSQYIKGPFNIKLPLLTKEEDNLTNTIDFLLVPLICFDIEKNRIGYGGGYYDNFLKNNRKGRMKSIGIAGQCLKYSENKHFCEEWDEKLDYIITEKQIY